MNPIPISRPSFAIHLALLVALLGGGASAIALLAPAAKAEDPRHRVLVMRSVTSEKFAYRPHSVVIAPRGIFEVKKIRWRQYGGEVATATAVVHGRGCQPLCDGPRFKRKAKLRLEDVRKCKGVWAYSFMDVTFDRSAPSYGKRSSWLILPAHPTGDPACGPGG